MPILDAEKMLRDGSTALTTTETGDGVLVGDCPSDGLQIMVYAPAGATCTWAIQQSDDNSSFVALDPAVGAASLAAGSVTYRAFWTRKYLRWIVSGWTSGTPGAVQVGIVPGRLAQT